ncbi:DUF6792 domain-containing protein [Cytobacillus purgationiresistens]|uniref:DUF6792 domain-containing protein n=1 Tax=Cytobacillus purgationiresistens TaxID=863449 RepID=A0ABU0APY8_9BACI|nr:DUF6792 domain-containing protein [Cytobacillus purgationiresistens]MDQ0273317.1 hypothetical protein [Cytobacillus purgationiresistens]
MSNEEILNTNILLARITELEYGKSEKISEEEIRRIYIEETGKDLPVEITVYHSDDIKELKEQKDAGKDSGFDGTIIHFYNPIEGINQSYTITRGSEHSEDSGEGEPLDWYYNGFGIFTGKVKNQFENAETFDDLITKKINFKVTEDLKRGQKSGEHLESIELNKVGIGHSLGGNLIQTLQIMNDSFSSVYAINDAPPSVYQLAMIDTKFQFSLGIKFNIDPNINEQLYSIPPAELKAFAENYYKERGQNIHHITAEEDMLYGASDIRGFLDLGTREIIDTDLDFEGLRKTLGNISDGDLRKLQMFLAEIAPYYNQNGVQGVYRGLTGIDAELFTLIDTIGEEWNKLIDGPDWKFVGVDMHFSMFPLGFGAITVPFPVPEVPTKLLAAIGLLQLRQVEIMARLERLRTQIPSLIKILGATMIVMIEDVLNHLKDILGSVKNMISSLGDLGKVVIKDILKPGSPNISEYLVGVIDIAATVKVEAGNIKSKFTDIFNVPFDWFRGFTKAVEAHGLTHVATALADGNRRYEGNDMILSKGSHLQKVEVNLSSAVRVYQLGMDKYQDKKEVISRLKSLYTQEFIDDFQHRKGRLVSAINQMETNPRSYQYLLPGGNVEMKGITVHEHIRPLDSLFADTFEEIFQYLDREVDSGIKLIKKIRDSIEQLFQEDQKISAIFDLR